MEDADLSLKQALANGKKVVVRESDYAATQPFYSFGDLLFDHIYVKELVLYCCIASSFHSDIFPCVLGWLCGELLSFRDTCGELLHSSPAEVLGRLVGYLKLGRGQSIWFSGPVAQLNHEGLPLTLERSAGDAGPARQASCAGDALPWRRIEEAAGG